MLCMLNQEAACPAVQQPTTPKHPGAPPAALTEAAHVAQVAKVVGAHQRQQHVIVLLALVLVHRGDLWWGVVGG